jgi:hypothetical protein
MARMPGFIGPSYKGTSALADPEELVNWYVEQVDSPSPTNQYVYQPTPGLVSRITVPQAPIRALYKVPASTQAAERGFFVAGAKLYEFFSDFSSVLRGTLSGVGPDPATIHYNGDGGGQLLVTSASGGESYDLATNVLTPIAGLAAFQGGMLNGYGLALDQTTSTLRLSNLLDMATWDPTQFAQRSIAPDPWKAMVVLYPRIYLFGSETTEVWFDAGEFPFPFSPVQGILIQEGIEAPFSATVASNAIYWLAQSGDGTARVVRTAGYRPETVSTRAVEQAITSYAQAGRIDDAVAWVYQLDGHEFYLLNFPSAGVTWVYDTALPAEIGWHKRGTWIDEDARYIALRPQYHAFIFGKHVVGDRETGAIYEMRNTYAQDVNGREIRRLRRTPLMSAEQQWVFFKELQLFLETGLGTASGQGEDPQVMLRWSDDGGKTWGNTHRMSAGRMGAYKTRVIQRRLGRARNRVFEITVSDPVPWRLVDAFMDVAVQKAVA